MKRERIARLREIFEDAMSVVHAEWNFGHFKAANAAVDKEAEEIFTELLAEAECDHDFRSANMGSPDARIYRCTHCGEEEERDVS